MKDSPDLVFAAESSGVEVGVRAARFPPVPTAGEIEEGLLAWRIKSEKEKRGEEEKRREAGKWIG
jgi:hypothetical protein